MMLTMRCGQGLEDLYNSPQVQSYLNSAPLRCLYQDKTIYASGTLRKVHKGNGYLCTTS